jgi:hypothetical protein
MRTTLDIDDAVLRAARALARQTDVSVGRALSELAKRGLSAGAPATSGFPMLPRATADHVISDALVDEHRDEQP